MSNLYPQNAELKTIQGTITCAIMTKMNTVDRTIEVGCGPGRHSVTLASNFLRQNGVLVSCDISSEMVKSLDENYKSSDFGQVLGNKFSIDTETDYLSFTDDQNLNLVRNCNLDKIISDHGNFKKFVYGCRANNELLPFADQTFNAYISNLSLMIVSNPEN